MSKKVAGNYESDLYKLPKLQQDVTTVSSDAPLKIRKYSFGWLRRVLPTCDRWHERCSLVGQLRRGIPNRKTSCAKEVQYVTRIHYSGRHRGITP